MDPVGTLEDAMAHINLCSERIQVEWALTSSPYFFFPFLSFPFLYFGSLSYCTFRFKKVLNERSSSFLQTSKILQMLKYNWKG